MTEENDERIYIAGEEKVSIMEGEEQALEVVGAPTEELEKEIRKEQSAEFMQPGVLPEPPGFVKHLRTRADVKLHNRLKQAMAKRKK